MPTTGLDTLPRTERFENRQASARYDPELGIGSRHTLKLLSVSILLDRSVLLSSKWLKQSPPSCAPKSGAPWPVSFLWPANSDRNLPMHPGRLHLAALSALSASVPHSYVHPAQ